MRKMILGSVAAAAICVFTQPDDVKPNGTNGPYGIETRAAGIKTATAETLPACHDLPDYYVNSDRKWVHRPECIPDRQPRETAMCRDRSHSFSLHHNGTCSHHGGVARWE
jgi:hypothetical protein